VSQLLESARTGAIDSDNSLVDSIGGTPLVRLHRLAKGIGARVFVKPEYLNPSGSVKDRIAIALIEDAEQRGLLKPGGTIIEPTSGNTGASLAMIAAIRGYKCVVVTPEKTSSEKVATMRAYGAEVVIAPNASEDDPRAYTNVAARMAREIPGAYMPDQYSNPLNPLACQRTIGIEIWEQTRGRVTHFVAGIGTGGTVCGIARALKQRNPKIQVIGVDPIGSVYSGGEPKPYAVEGIGRHYFPKTLDMSVIDSVERVSDREAFLMARRAAHEEGLLVGGSSGAALVGALRVARSLSDPSTVLVVVLPDSGRAYLTKIFNDDFVATLA
jgi:cystathionine beta-synthase